jgi:hypothetical protein
MTPQLRYALWQITGRRPSSPRRDFSNRRGPARNWRYRAWIRSQPSVVSERPGCEAAHTGVDGGMRQKASDYSCVPLTPEEHREYHRIGKEAFERLHGIDFAGLVRDFNRAWFDRAREVK